MNWDDLRIFMAAVRAGTYQQAGADLGINRTTVGRRIDGLEAALGVTLFRETPFGHEPTEEGREVIAAASEIERQVDAVLARYASAPQRPRTVRVASSAGVAVEFLPEFAAFMATNPDIAIEFVGALDPLEAVRFRRADLALALVRRPPARLEGVEVGTLRQARYRRRGTEDAKPLGWGREIEAALPGQWTTANPSGDAAQADGVSRFNSWSQLRDAVRAGLGEAHLWTFAGEADPMLERLAEPDPRHDSPLWLLRLASPSPGAHLTRLIDYLAEALARRLAR